MADYRATTPSISSPPRLKKQEVTIPKPYVTLWKVSPLIPRSARSCLTPKLIAPIRRNSYGQVNAVSGSPVKRMSPYELVK